MLIPVTNALKIVIPWEGPVDHTLVAANLAVCQKNLGIFKKKNVFLVTT